MDIVKLKGQMRSYAERRKLTVPRIMWRSKVWGTGAMVLAYRVSRHKTGRGTTVAAKLWAMFNPDPSLHILQPTYHWAGAPTATGHQPPYIVWHHAAGYGSPEQIHQAHLSIGDRGIAYHLYVDTKGKVYQGRPFGTFGAHCLGHNDSVGICFEGNWDVNPTMSKEQLAAGRAVHRYLHKRYPGAKDIRHRDVPGNATACPGRFFDFATITQ